jgi:hypothetical protein
MTNNFYPLAVGNEWKYMLSDGANYTNTVISVDIENPSEFTMTNSMMNKNQIIRKDGPTYLTDSFESGALNVFLKDNLTIGETWEIKFKANSLDNLLIMKVMELNSIQTVNGITFLNVIKIEAESKIRINGGLMALNYFTQYFYANDVGLILTTSSRGDSQSLTECNLK